MKGDKAALRTLLQQKADVNLPQADGATAMHWAVYRDDVDAVDQLMLAGAKADVANGETMLMLAARNGQPETIYLLVKAGAQINAKERLRGTTALMWAAEQRHPA